MQAIQIEKITTKELKSLIEQAVEAKIQSFAALLDQRVTATEGAKQLGIDPRTFKKIARMNNVRMYQTGNTNPKYSLSEFLKAWEAKS